jgi:hypothetical protein
MAKRRKVTTVTLTAEQHERLERLWFYFGNYGPKTTSGNHSFIQRLLEQGIDERSLHTKRTPKSELPTPECEAAVEAVLAIKSDSGSGGECDGTRGFRLIRISEEQRCGNNDAQEIKAIVDDMKRRYILMHMQPEEGDDTLDAA